MNKELKPESALDSLFIYQEEFQKILGYENVPFDDPIMMKQHILGLKLEKFFKQISVGKTMVVMSIITEKKRRWKLQIA